MSSCVREDLHYGTVEEGLPVTTTLTFSASGSNNLNISTKAELDDYSVISSLYLFIFNADGTHCEDIIEVPSSDITETNGSGNGKYYEAKISTTTGTKRIFAVANYIEVESWVGHADNGSRLSFKETLANLGFRVMTEGLTMSQVAAETVYLTDTYLNNGTTPEYPTQQMIFTSDTDGDEVKFNANNSSTGQINLQRIVANVIFNIMNGTDSRKIISFTPTSYQLFKISKATRLGSDREMEENPSEAGQDFYYNGSQQTLTATSSGGKFTFSFFIPENIQAENEITEYSQRDEWAFNSETGENVGSSNASKDFTYAPDNATYIVIRGEYAEYESNDGVNQGQLLYSGNTSYVIHLGNMDKSNGGSLGDFSVRRNWKYTYNITINGVQSIANEATGEDLSDTGQGKEPGAEGSIVDIEDMTVSYSLDAHYEQVLLSYNLTSIVERIIAQGGISPDSDSNGEDDTDGIPDIDELIGNNLILYIESPFQEESVTKIPYFDYVKAVTNNLPEGNAKTAYLEDADYKWVEFWPQNNNTSLASYPGLSRWKNGGIDIRQDSDDNERLLDAYDVCVKLGKAVKKLWEYWYKHSNDDNINFSSALDNKAYAEDGITVTYVNGNWYAYFTGFVDEYYYTEYPVTANGHMAGDSVERWSEFTNKNQRRMMISMDIEVSPDGNSTYSRAHTNISQRSIQTFYDDDTDEPITAFGMETFNETPRMQYGTPSNGNKIYSDTDGRWNTLTMLDVGNENAYNWAYYIDETENGHKTSISGRRTLNNAYNSKVAFAACLSRNRDLNGNGKIDIYEVKWYMPSINEYIRIGMGATAVSNEAQLYFGDKRNLTRTGYPVNFLDYGALYYTSTYNSNKTVFWAVEKGSYGGQHEQYECMIRCVRLLPSDVNAVFNENFNEIPASVYKATLRDGNYFFDFRGRLTPELFRQIPNTYPYNFLQHDEDSEYNRFYSAMILSKDYMSTGWSSNNINATLVELQNIGNNRTNPCADYHEDGEPANAGWRLPNLAELSVLASNYDDYVSKKLPNDGRALVPACTQFSNQNVRQAFYINRSRMVTCDDGYDYNFYVRCVRDATAEELSDVSR